MLFRGYDDFIQYERLKPSLTERDEEYGHFEVCNTPRISLFRCYLWTSLPHTDPQMSTASRGLRIHGLHVRYTVALWCVRGTGPARKPVQVVGVRDACASGFSVERDEKD